MADNNDLKIKIQAELDPTKSRNNITKDVSNLENTPFWIRLIARLYKNLSKANINNDIKALERSAPSLRINGRLNRATTRRNIRNDADSLANSANVTLGAQIDRNELQQSVDTARNDIEQNLHNNPINVPVNVNVNGNIDNGVQQVQNLNNQVRNARGILGDYLTAREIFRAVTDSIKKAVDEVEALNKAQTNLQIATSKSATEMKSLMQDYNQLAKDMSSTTLDVTDAADDYLRQGQSIADTNTLIKDSLILSKIGEIESRQATEYLTSAMKGYKTEAEDVISIVDKLSAVDLESASNSGELAEAMSKVSNVARSAGVEIDTLIAYLATAKDITQDDASVIGNSFRSIFTRLNNIKIGKFLDEDGNDISGEINDAERVLSKFNISLRDNAKEFRDAQDIIADVANAWETMSSVEQAAIRKAFANTYQAEKFTAIMTNYNKVLQLTEVSQNSAGTAMEKFSIYENSLEAATNRLTASLEGLAYNTIDGDSLKGLANATAGIVEFVDSTKLLKTGLTAGIFTGAIAGLVALGTRMVAVRNNVTQFTQAMNISRSATTMTANQYNTLRTLVSGLSEAQLRLVLSNRQLTEAQRLQLMQDAGIEQARQRQLLQTWNLTNATNAQTTATFSLRGAWEGLKASIVANPIGLIVTALTLATTAITTLKQKQEELRESISETAKEAKEQTDNLNDLIKSYEEFAGKISYTAEEKEKLKDIQEQLSDLYHTEVDDIDLVNGKYDEEIAKLKELKKEKLQNAELSLSAEREQAKRDANYKNLSDKRLNITSDWFKSEDDYNKISSELENSLKYNFSTDIGWIQKAIGYDSQLHFYGNAEDRVKQIQEAMSILKKYGYANIGLYSELNDLLSEYQGYVDTELESVSNLAENMFQQYELDNPYKEVGQDSYLAWRDGLLATAGDDEDLRRQLFALAEKQFPDYSKYFDNLSKARSMFVRANSASEAEWAKEKDNYLEKLSPEDLEIATKIPDLFADGLDGATAKIEAWKADPNNKITTDVEVDDADLSTMLETTSKKVKLITTAMEEMNDTGSISSSTYGEIVEIGGNFADCLEVQNGKLKLNVQKLKELERQELLNAIAAKDLAISELNVAAAMAGQSHNAEKVEEIRKQITALEEERAVLWQINDEIANAKPNESSSGGSSSSSDPWKEQFDKKYSEKQHLLTMEQLSEEDYLDWLDDAYKKYFSDLTKYQDEYYKYEEEVYKGRKQLAEDFYDEQQKLFEDRVSNLETNIEVATKYSTDADGNKLDIEEKYDYISSAYQEIINEINAHIGEILDTGIEGHEEEVAKLEKQIEEYQEKLAEVPKDAAKEEQDYIKKLKDDYEDLYDERINQIKDEQKAAKEAAQAEIDAVQDKIDALKKANEEQQTALDIEKARQDLANASQRTRQVYGADGSISFQVDKEKVKEAQEKLDKLLQEQQINILEEQKQALEDAKDKASESYDKIIENLETEKENGEKRFNKLIEKLDEYLNPNNGESNSDVWKAIAKLEGGKYENGIYTDKDGNVIDIDKLLETDKTEDKQTDTDNKTKDNSKDDTVISGTLTRQDIGDEEPDIKDKTESAIDAFFSNLEKKLNMPSGSINLENAMQVFRNSPMMNFNPYGAMNDRTGLANKEYVSNVNNNNNAANVTIGDININNPVGNSYDLAKELQANLHNAADKIIYSNLK